MLFVPPSFTATESNYPHVVLMLAQEQRSRSLAVYSSPDLQWHQYLDSMSEPQGRFATGHIDKVRLIWREVCDRVGTTCPLPITQPSGDDDVQLAWDNGQQYLDLEIAADGNLHWYFRDRVTGEVNGTEEERVSVLPAEFFAKLHLLTHGT